MSQRDADFFGSFSSATRNRLLEILGREGEVSVQDLAARLLVAQPTISRHLRVLRLQKIVTRRREGALHLYSLNEEEIIERMKDFLALLGITTDIRRRREKWDL